jgi:hypothetical protein
MASKQLASLMRSVPPATARTEQHISPAAAVAQPEPTPRRPPAVPPTAFKEEAEVPLQVLIPARIREELGIMGAKERVSLRALILRGVRSLGIHVTEEEIRGKRGRRGP